MMRLAASRSLGQAATRPTAVQILPRFYHKTDEALTIKNTDIAKHLSLHPVKLAQDAIAQDAIKAAVEEDYKTKRTQSDGKSEGDSSSR